MDALRITFALRELAEVEPWGDPNTGLSLHWFGLTDGWYDIEIGEHHLFRDEGGDAHGIDYYVVRLWEDLIELAPSLMEEVPEALAVRLAAGDRWDAWAERAWELEDVGDLYQVGLSWWNERHLDTGYLRGRPRLYLWRRGEEVHVHWRSLSRGPDDPIWSSPYGDAITTFASFRDELARFDRELIRAMADRVESSAKAWTRPEIEIDLDQLRHEQADRATRFQRALTRPPPQSHSWDDVIAAVTTLERSIGSALTD